MKDAYRSLIRALSYPDAPSDSRSWSEAFGIFAAIMQAAGAKQEKLAQVAEDPCDVQALYECGYELIDREVPEVAASVFSRANALAPNQPKIISELATALEHAGLHRHACEVLHAEPEFLESDFTARYLLAFNSFMTGNLEEPRGLLSQLQNPRDRNEAAMAARIRTWLQRADAISSIGRKLDEQDLRGWHFVINGAVLLGLSVYGFDRGMNGRFAFIQDEYGACLEGIRRLQALLETWDIRIPRVWELPNRESAVLAYATSAIFGVPIERWPTNGCTTPGLVVVYDMKLLAGNLRKTLQECHPGQILWAHASCWTEMLPASPDVTTYLYEQNVAPWIEKSMKPRESRENELDSSFPDVVAENILTAATDESFFDDLDALREFALAVRSLPPDIAPGALRQTGVRPHQWECSPVSSTRLAGLT